MTDAIVLAGGGVEPGLEPGLPNKGFLLLAGRPLVAHVVSTLTQTPSINRVAVVGPAQELRPVVSPPALVVEAVGGIMDNIVRGVEALQARDLVLVAASDIPLLTPAVVEEFLDACTAIQADFYYPIVPQDVMLTQFPAARKTFVTVAEGTFTGGSMMLFNPQVLERVRPFVERLVAARKKPWLLAQTFGWSIVVKFMSGRLTIPEVVARAAEVTGLAVTPVIVPRPELALDVDVGKPENVDEIRRAMEPPRRGDGS